MLAGGLCRPDRLYTQMGFSQLRAMSPTGRCAPFDARADGLVVGEGAGLVVLMRLAEALRAGRRIYGVLAGIGLSNDLEGNLLAPSSEVRSGPCSPPMPPPAGRPGCGSDRSPRHGHPGRDAVEMESLKRLWAARPKT